MGRGRARVVVAGIVAALALAVAGCGAETHPNDPRPQVALHVAVSIGPKAVTVQPAAIAVGPAPTQQIPQNQSHPQPPIKTDDPVTVVLIAANQTRFDSHLELHGPTDFSSGPVLAHSPGNFQTELPTGTYTVTAADIPGARPAKLVVGPFRASSKNDILLP
jgi:hypothetical protein